MLKIRFSLAGKSGQRMFHIVVIDSRFKRESGRKLDKIGFYSTNTKEKKINQEKVKMWIKKGAQPTKTVKELFIKEKII